MTVTIFVCNLQMGNISRFSGFDKPHRNRLSETFLPNTINRVANYGYKAFCGTYSKKGDIFLCASQGMNILYTQDINRQLVIIVLCFFQIELFAFTTQRMEDFQSSKRLWREMLDGLSLTLRLGDYKIHCG